MYFFKKRKSKHDNYPKFIFLVNFMEIYKMAQALESIIVIRTKIYLFSKADHNDSWSFISLLISLTLPADGQSFYFFFPKNLILFHIPFFFLKDSILIPEKDVWENFMALDFHSVPS